jgi:dipeptidyl-peptidase 4
MDDFPREHAEFPREYARTQRFTLGRPRSITVSPDGSRVVFTRSRGGTDPVNCLWVYDVADKTERLVADPRALLGGGNEQVSEEERARRERTRELAGGITSYATDAEAVSAAFALNGKLFRADLTGGTRVYDLGVDGPAFDPRPSPDGGYVAYVAGGGLHVIDEDGRTHTVVQEDGVSWGVAEFVAAEEMGRHRGFWWSPDSDRLLAARVDDSPVQRWHIADPANPGREPVEIAYPRAGTANADVRLSLLGLYGTRVDLDWDRDEFPYLVTVHWSEYGPPLVLVQSRDQRRTRLLTIDVDTGAVATLREDTSPTWLEIMPGVPAWTPGGELVWVVEDLATDTRRLVVDGTPATPAGMHVRGVAAVDATGVVVSVSEADPAVTSLVRVRPDGSLERLADGGGVHAYAGAGGTSVVATAALDGPTTYQVTSGDAPAGTLASLADEPSLELNLTLRWAADLRAAVLLPHGHQPGVRLPVLVSPYGGPGAQRVLAARNSYLQDQWFADQGYAVVVVDGRGTPGRTLSFEKAIAGGYADPVLDDQVAGLRALAEQVPELDLDRVAIRGWSFGGYLAAMAVLRRPEVFHAAIAGAPVTDSALYDTHYTERYLGMPDERPEAYRHNSLIDDAPNLRRPLLMIHGLADDNVIAAHTLRFSSALLAAGRPHQVLPLSGVTHFSTEEDITAGEMQLELAFLRDALA